MKWIYFSIVINILFLKLVVRNSSYKTISSKNNILKLEKFERNLLDFVESSDDSLNKLTHSKKLIDSIYAFLEPFLAKKASIIGALKSYVYFKEKIKNYDTFKKEIDELEKEQRNFKTNTLNLIDYFKLEETFKNAKNENKIKYGETNIYDKIQTTYYKKFVNITDNFNENMKGVVTTIVNGRDQYVLLKQNIEKLVEDNKNTESIIISSLIGVDVIKDLTKISDKINNFKTVFITTKANLTSTIEKYSKGTYIFKELLMLLVLYLI